MTGHAVLIVAMAVLVAASLWGLFVVSCVVIGGVFEEEEGAE